MHHSVLSNGGRIADRTTGDTIVNCLRLSAANPAGRVDQGENKFNYGNII
jgi:hypothetical protein